MDLGFGEDGVGVTARRRTDRQRLVRHECDVWGTASAAFPHTVSGGIVPWSQPYTLVPAGPYIKWFLEKLGHTGLNNMLGRRLVERRRGLLNM